MPLIVVHVVTFRVAETPQAVRGRPRHNDPQHECEGYARKLTFMRSFGSITMRHACRCKVMADEVIE
jgi:hypothetical protein